MSHPTWRLAVATAAAAMLLPLTGATGVAHPGDGQLRATDLTTEHLADPLGIDTVTPRLSWIDRSNDNGAAQTAYEIVVSTGEDGSGEVWHSGKVPSARAYDVTYAGRPLRSGTRHFWAVRVWA